MYRSRHSEQNLPTLKDAVCAPALAYSHAHHISVSPRYRPIATTYENWPTGLLGWAVFDITEPAVVMRRSLWN
jgi:hypothetical protein